MAKTVDFANGAGSIPTVGLGTWTVFGAQGESNEVEEAVKAAIDAGYRHIDCAWVYGTQDGVGQALQAKIKDRTIKREDVFITTKLWNTHHNPKLVAAELKDSLKNLQTSYIDLYLVHWPVAFEDQDMSREVVCPDGGNGKGKAESYPLEDVWKAMEECQTSGLAKHIGISNFNSKQITRILNVAKIKPVMLQVEVSPYFSNSKLIDFCKSKGLAVTAYAPLGAPGRPWKETGEPNVFQDKVLQDIAKSKGKTIAQVVLRSHLQRGIIVIPKSITPSRIRENFDLYGFTLTDDEMKQIATLDRNLRVYKEPIADTHKEYPFNEPF